MGERYGDALAAAGWLAFVLAQWALSLASVLSCLLPLVVLVAIGRAVARKRWTSVAVIIATTPFTVPFARGLVTYGRDDAHLVSPPFHGRGAEFIDSYTRLPVTTHGCFVDDSEWVQDLPYDAALHLLSALVGPQSGTYDGPIPTEQQARHALTDASPVPWRELYGDEVSVDGRRVRLESGLGRDLVAVTYALDLSDTEQIRARLWRGRVLFVELRVPFPLEGASHVAVVDAASGRLLGHFRAAWSPHRLPRPWTPPAAAVVGAPDPADRGLRCSRVLLQHAIRAER